MDSTNQNTSNAQQGAPSYEKARRRFLAVWTWVGAVLLTAVAVYLLNLLSVPVGILLWTVVIVFTLGGIVNFLDRRGVPRLIGTLFAFAILVVALVAIVYVMFSPGFGMSAQFTDLIESLPGYIENFRQWANDLYEEHADILQNGQIQQWAMSAIAAVGQSAQSIASASASGVVAAGASIVNIALTIGFAAVVAFWMLMDLPKIKREFMRLVGEKHAESARMLYLTFTRVVGGYLKATIIQCVIIGIGCGILYVVLDTPSPAALGTITGLLNIIPIVGPWLGGGMVFVITVFSSPVKAIAAFVGAIIVQQIVYTFISPRIMGQSVDIHPALTFLALTGGAAIGGAMSGLLGALVGTLLAIPAVACAKAVFVYYFEKNTGRRIVSEDGVFFKGVTPEDDEDGINPMADATAVAPAAAAAALPMIPVLHLKDSGETGDKNADHPEKG